MSTSHATLKLLRKLHLYIGVFLSPALLFFAFTGALQTFSFHEAHAGSDYKPPAWIATLAQIHKKQTTVIPPRKNRPGMAQKPDDDTSTHAAHSHKEASGSGPAKPADAAVKPIDTTARTADSPPSPPQKSHLPLKLFFLLVSIGLFTSTLTGLYMSYKYNQSKLVITALLVAGIIVPLLLLPF
jgi:hypothetical protein